MEITTWSRPQLPAIVALLNRSSPEDRFTLDQVREAVFDDHDLDDHLLRCVTTGAGEVIGAISGVIRGDRGHIKLFGVDPAWRRRGIGTRLIATIEDELRARGATVCRVFQDAPYYLRPGVDFRLTELVSMLERRDYQFRGAACNMLVDLATAPLDTADDEARLAREGFTVRRLEVGDRSRLDALATSPNWKTEVARSLSRDPISTHIALQDDRIVAFATHSVSGPGHFGPMQTDPSLRGRGIGALLLRRCLADLRDGGHATCDIQWVGPKGFYADHVGARIHRCFWQYEKSLV